MGDLWWCGALAQASLFFDSCASPQQQTLGQLVVRRTSRGGQSLLVYTWMGDLWATHGQPMGRNFKSMGDPLDDPWTTQGQYIIPVPMSDRWATHWKLIGDPWDTIYTSVTHGRPKGQPCNTHECMGNPWDSIIHPWVPHGTALYSRG